MPPFDITLEHYTITSCTFTLIFVIIFTVHKYRIISFTPEVLNNHTYRTIPDGDIVRILLKIRV